MFSEYSAIDATFIEKNEFVRAIKSKTESAHSNAMLEGILLVVKEFTLIELVDLDEPLEGEKLRLL